MSSKWRHIQKLPASDPDDDLQPRADNKNFCLTPLSHHQWLKDEDEDRKSLIDSEEVPLDDLDDRYSPPPPPQNETTTDLDENPIDADVENVGSTPLESVNQSSTNEKPTAIGKWGITKPSSGLNQNPTDSSTKPAESHTKPVNQVAQPNKPKPQASPWTKHKTPTNPIEETNLNPMKETGTLASTDNVIKKPAASAWTKFKPKAAGSQQTTNEPPTRKLSLGALANTGSSNKQASSWGKFKQAQGISPTIAENGDGTPAISLEDPGARALDSMAGAAYAVHATQKVTGLLKEKASARIRLREKLALKERMSKLVAERLTIKQIFKRYVETSTLHGFCYVASDTFIIRRAVWAILMILGAVYFLLKLKDGIEEYFMYPFTTLTSTEMVGQLIFPAISFCPINPYKIKGFNTSVLNRIHQTNGLPVSSNWTDPGFDVDGDELYQAIIDHSFNIEDIVHDCDWISRDTDHPEIAQRNCGPHNFTKYIAENGEVCYTVNSGKKGHHLLHVDDAGMGYGYELLFDLNSVEAVINEPYNGIKVILHDQSEPPVSTTGFVLTPGHKSFVKLVKTETKNLPPPVATNCGSKNLKYFENYNQKACLLEIVTDMVGKECKCRQFYMPDNGLRYCSLQEELKCVLPFKDQISSFKLMHNCPIDCLVTKYEAKVTDSRFLHNPPQGFEISLMEASLARKGENSSHLLELYKSMSHKELDVYIEENMISVIFFYTEMKKHVNEQIKTFSFYNFLGDMGGEIGLMLGASLLTFFEFVDLIIFLLYHQLLRLHKQKKIERKSVLFDEETQMEKPKEVK